MDTPKPIDVNRLKAMLGGAKAIMQKVESGNYETGNVDPRALTEDTIQQVASERGGGRPSQRPASNEGMYKNLEKSKMPEAIKKAMLENPIPVPNSPNYTFALEDVMDYEKDEKRVPPPKVPQRKAALTENRMQQHEELVGLTESQVRDIVNDEMVNFLSKYFVKNLREETQKKVIQQLIKEGKLKVKK